MIERSTAISSLLRWALWFGVLSGLGQALLVAVVRLTTNRLVMISPDVVWMAPLANTAIFIVAGLVLHVIFSAMARPAAAAGARLTVFISLLLLGPFSIVPRLHPYASIILMAGIAVQGTRLIRPRLDMFDAMVRRTLPWLAVLSFVLGVGLHLSRDLKERWVIASLPDAANSAPNVILIVLDTVRAQNLSLYGYHRQTSPTLDELAKTGVVFDRALSTAPWTLSSHGSFFTGRLPHELSADWLTPLDGEHITLAEALSSRGYVTAGFVANLLYTTREAGLSRGFTHYSDYPITLRMLIHNSWLARAVIRLPMKFAGTDEDLIRRGGADITREFVAWVRSRPQKPFFAFLNYFDAHAPYQPVSPFDTKFGKIGPQPDPRVQRNWSPQEIQWSVNAYDGTLAYVDSQVAVLLEALKSENLLEDTLIIVTSDHGEQFGEHGLFDHANSLYRQLLHVPLLMSFPPHVPAGVRVSKPVSLLDLPATILDLVGGGTHGVTLPGRSMSEYWHSIPHSQRGTPLFAEVNKGINLPEWVPVNDGSMQSVVVEGKHYIRSSAGREELYDFDNDADEVTDLASRPESGPSLENARRVLAEISNQTP